MIESTLSGQQCQALFIPLLLSLAGQKSAYCQNNPVAVAQAVASAPGPLLAVK